MKLGGTKREREGEGERRRRKQKNGSSKGELGKGSSLSDKSLPVNYYGFRSLEVVSARNSMNFKAVFFHYLLRKPNYKVFSTVQF